MDYSRPFGRRSVGPDPKACLFQFDFSKSAKSKTKTSNKPEANPRRATRSEGVALHRDSGKDTDESEVEVLFDAKKSAKSKIKTPKKTEAKSRHAATSERGAHLNRDSGDSEVHLPRTRGKVLSPAAVTTNGTKKKPRKASTGRKRRGKSEGPTARQQRQGSDSESDLEESHVPSSQPVTAEEKGTVGKSKKVNTKNEFKVPPQRKTKSEAPRPKGRKKILVFESSSSAVSASDDEEDDSVKNGASNDVPSTSTRNKTKTMGKPSLLSKTPKFSIESDSTIVESDVTTKPANGSKRVRRKPRPEGVRRLSRPNSFGGTLSQGSSGIMGSTTLSSENSENQVSSNQVTSTQSLPSATSAPASLNRPSPDRTPEREIEINPSANQLDNVEEFGIDLDTTCPLPRNQAQEVPAQSETLSQSRKRPSSENSLEDGAYPADLDEGIEQTPAKKSKRDTTRTPDTQSTPKRSPAQRATNETPGIPPRQNISDQEVSGTEDDDDEEHDALFIIEQDAASYTRLQNADATNNAMLASVQTARQTAGFLEPVFTVVNSIDETPGVTKTYPVQLSQSSGIGYVKIAGLTIQPPQLNDDAALAYWVLSGEITVKSAGGHYQVDGRSYLYPKQFGPGACIVIPKDTLFTLENWFTTEVVLGYCFTRDSGPETTLNSSGS